MVGHYWIWTSVGFLGGQKNVPPVRGYSFFQLNVLAGIKLSRKHVNIQPCRCRPAPVFHTRIKWFGLVNQKWFPRVFDLSYPLLQDNQHLSGLQITLIVEVGLPVIPDQWCNTIILRILGSRTRTTHKKNVDQSSILILFVCQPTWWIIPRIVGYQSP